MNRFIHPLSDSRRLGYLLACLCLFGSCNQEEALEPAAPTYPISLSVTPEIQGNSLTWSKIDGEAFERYWVIRSADSLPDDLKMESLGGLEAAQYDAPEITAFFDEEAPRLPVIYYKVIGDLGDRMVISPTVALRREVYGLDEIGAEMIVEPIYNTLFIKSHEDAIVTAFNYEKKDGLSSIGLSRYDMNLMAGAHNGKSELYAFERSSREVSIFPIEPLAKFTRHTFDRQIVSMASDGRGKLFVSFGGSDRKVGIFDRNSMNETGSITGGGASHLTIIPGGPPGGTRLLDFSGREVHAYNLDQNGTLVSRESRPVVGSSNNSQTIAIHPDGDFIMPFENGLAIDKNLNSVVTQIGGRSSTFAFTQDGSTLYHIRSSRVSIHEIPSFELMGDFRVGHSNIGIFSDTDDGKLLLVGNATIDGKFQAFVEIIPFP
ncbi:MAG: hypothetical protein AAGI38_07460 [Bacteroidota bacterium]